MLRQAAEQLWGGITLDDLSAFVTVGRLTQASGLSNGAVYSAHSASDQGRSAPQSAMREAFLRMDPADDELVLGVIEQLHESFDATIGPDFLEHVASQLSPLVAHSARSPEMWDYTHFWLGAAVANNDSGVASAVRQNYRSTIASYSRAVERLLGLTGRELIDGIDLVTLVTMMVAGADGIALVLRLDPEADPSLIEHMLLAVFAATTRLTGGEDPLTPLVIASTDITEADDAETYDATDAAVRAAVRQITDRTGWHEVDLRKVAELTGLHSAGLAVRYPTVHHLATLLWDDEVDKLRRAARSRESLDHESQVTEFVHDLARMACSRRSLVNSLLIVRLLRSRTDVGSSGRPLEDLLAGMLADDPSTATTARSAAYGIVHLVLAGAAEDDVGPVDLANLALRLVGR